MTEPRLADRLREWRLILGLTQRELARRSGVTAGNLSHIEQGLTSPSLDTLTKIARALDISLQRFLFEAPCAPFTPEALPALRDSAFGQAYRLNACTHGLILSSLEPIKLSELLILAGLAVTSGQLVAMAGEGLVSAGELRLTLAPRQPLQVHLPQAVTLLATQRQPWHLLWSLSHP